MSLNEIHYVEGCYCSLCDYVFFSEEERSAHLQWASNHPSCGKCNFRFPDKHGLRVHYSISNEHRYCSSCDALFKSAAGLRAHSEFSSAHRGEASFRVDEDMEDWEEFYGFQFFPCENTEFELRTRNEKPAEQEQIWVEDYELDYDEDDELYQHISDLQVLEQLSKPDSSEENQASDVDELACSNCTLCQGPYDDQISAIKCGHVFCTPCITRSLKKRKACPVCDLPARARNLRTLYLF